MKFAFRQEGTVGVVTVTGRLDAATAGDFKAGFTQALPSASRFVFDLGGLDFIDSTGIGAIVSALRQATEKDGDIRIGGLSPKARMVFEITRAYRMFDIFDDTAAAVGSFG